MPLHNIEPRLCHASFSFLSGLEAQHLVSSSLLLWPIFKLLLVRLRSEIASSCGGLKQLQCDPPSAGLVYRLISKMFSISFPFSALDSRMRHLAWLHTQKCCINTHTWITTAVNCGFCIHLQWTAGFNFNLGLIVCCFFSVQSVPGIGDTLCFKKLNDLEKDCLKAARGNFLKKNKNLVF